MSSDSIHDSTAIKPYDDSEITELSLRTLAIYQSQGHLIDRLWAYLNQYCILMLLLGLAAVPFKSEPAVSGIPFYMIFIPVGAFLVFSAANFFALRHSLDELFVMRGVAQQATRLRLSGSDRGDILRWHIIAVLLTLAIYGLCWFYVKSLWLFAQ